MDDDGKQGGRGALTVLGPRKNVSASEGDGDGLLLDGRGLLKALLEDAHEQLALEVVVLKVVTLGVRDVLEQVWCVSV